MEQLSHTIHQRILRAKKVLIVPHQNADGDALGSATALHEYVTNLSIPVAIFCVTPVTPKLHFVPKHQEVTTDPAIFSDKTIDTIVVVDSGDLQYNGIAKYVENHPATIINIDHHATNARYGHLNLVQTTAASTTEILFHYFRHNGVHINQKMATSLLTGLTTDTGNFTNGATTMSALNAGGELIRSGGNFNLINTSVLKTKSINTLRLWGVVLGRLTKHEPSNITYTYITRADLAEHQVDDSECEGIANFMNNLENAYITLILLELDNGKVKGSFRTTRNDVDVSLMAKQLGGGGHKKAAGFKVDGPVLSALNNILAMQPKTT